MKKTLKIGSALMALLTTISFTACTNAASSRSDNGTYITTATEMTSFIAQIQNDKEAQKDATTIVGTLKAIPANPANLAPFDKIAEIEQLNDTKKVTIQTSEKLYLSQKDFPQIPFSTLGVKLFTLSFPKTNGTMIGFITNDGPKPAYLDGTVSLQSSLSASSSSSLFDNGITILSINAKGDKLSLEPTKESGTLNSLSIAITSTMHLKESAKYNGSMKAIISLSAKKSFTAQELKTFAFDAKKDPSLIKNAFDISVKVQNVKNNGEVAFEKTIPEADIITMIKANLPKEVK